MDDIGAVLQLGVTQNDGEPVADYNISEVLHAISIADPSFVGVEEMYQSRQPTAPPPSAPQPSGPRPPYVRILEQPAGKSLRFRYECEGRSAGSIPGVRSTPERKTYPTIEVVGYTGRFVVLVSCVTKDKPYRPHPHNLVGREPMCNRGVCTVEQGGGDSSVVHFSNLGIQCVKRKDINEALRVREEIKVDPFKTGFIHKNQPQNIDLNAVRLCFQVYIPGGNTSKIKQALAPVVSDVIYDKKAMCELQINRLSTCSANVRGGTELILLCEKVTLLHKIKQALAPVVSVVIYDKKAMCELQINRLSTCSANVRGGTELILLCEKVTRDDTDVVFSQAFDDGTVWEASANIVLVHKQVAIAFQAPPYRDPSCMENVKVKIFLKRVSDGARSVPIDFEYTPDYTDSDYLSKKKRKTAQSIDSFLASYKQDRAFQESAIKTEPRDASPGLQIHSPPIGVASPSIGVASPHYPPPQYRDAEHQYQQWVVPDQSNLIVQNTNPFLTDPRGWSQNFRQTSPSPGLQAMSPGLQAMSPGLQAMSPGLQAMSPGLQAMSPGLHAMSPGMQAMSPGLQAMSPGMQTISPNMQAMSPNMQAMSPGHRLSPIGMQSVAGAMPMQGLVQMSPLQGGVSPGHQPSPMQPSPMHQPSPMQPSPMHQPSPMQPSPMHQPSPMQPSPMHQASPMHLTSPPPPHMQTMQNPGVGQQSLAQAMEGDMAFNSADLSGIIATLGPPELSDSLRQLSTSDLIPTMQHM